MSRTDKSEKAEKQATRDNALAILEQVQKHLGSLARLVDDAGTLSVECPEYHYHARTAIQNLGSILQSWKDEVAA